MRREYYYIRRGVVEKLQYRNRVSPHAAPCALLQGVPGAGSFNTAIGYHPMRHCYLSLYSHRISRFNTAIGYHPMRLLRRVGNFNGAIKLQKTSVAEAFALAFQYRSGVTPFAA